MAEGARKASRQASKPLAVAPTLSTRLAWAIASRYDLGRRLTH
jgi:hypothetical protein